MALAAARSAHRNPRTAIPRWHLIDAEGYVVGRLAKQIAPILMGKHKPTYHPSFPDAGDNVVVINAEKIQFAGKKLNKKVYRWHTGWPGGLKEMTAKRMMEDHPDRVLRLAVKGMLPVNRLREERMLRLKIFAGDKHPHGGQIATTPLDMKNRWVKGPTKHPVLNAYERPGMLVELEDLPDEWRVWVTEVSDKPEEARKQVAAYLADQKERHAKLRAEIMKSNPEILLGRDGYPLSAPKPAPNAQAVAGKPGTKPAAGGAKPAAPAGKPGKK